MSSYIASARLRMFVFSSPPGYIWMISTSVLILSITLLLIESIICTVFLSYFTFWQYYLYAFKYSLIFYFSARFGPCLRISVNTDTGSLDASGSNISKIYLWKFGAISRGMTILQIGHRTSDYSRRRILVSSERLILMSFYLRGGGSSLSRIRQIASYDVELTLTLSLNRIS